MARVREILQGTDKGPEGHGHSFVERGIAQTGAECVRPQPDWERIQILEMPLMNGHFWTSDIAIDPQTDDEQCAQCR